MTRSLVGAGGWGYFAGGLSAYARAFPFVEVNVTFYRAVSEEVARRWRSRVPEDFAFAVKVHRDVTHRGPLRPTPAARAAFARSLRIARALRAPFLILETPPSASFDGGACATLRDFASLVDRGTRLGLEARAHADGPLPAALRRTLEDARVLDVTDLSRTAPRVADDVVYTRLFGHGPANVWEFDDAELRALDRSGQDAKTVAYAFHGVRMYKDAARFVTFRRTGRFPAPTATFGTAGLAEVLLPDARFPMTREELLRAHGWKVLDDGRGVGVHASEWLRRLPPGNYPDLDAVLAALPPAAPAVETTLLDPPHGSK